MTAENKLTHVFPQKTSRQCARLFSVIRRARNTLHVLAIREKNMTRRRSLESSMMKSYSDCLSSLRHVR